MGHRNTILVIEGQSSSRDSIESMLAKSNYDIRVIRTGTEAVGWLGENEADLVIYDASTMRSNGVRICQRIRKVAERAPLIVCHATGDDSVRAAAADVYLERPFSGRKLLNRIRALLPADCAKEEIVRYGPLTLYRNKRSVEVSGRGEYTLTPKLALLLEQFIRHSNELLSRPQLMLSVWETDFIGDTRTLDVHVRWIRECIEDDPGKPQMLKTVRGQGYLLQLDHN